MRLRVDLNVYEYEYNSQSNFLDLFEGVNFAIRIGRALVDLVKSVFFFNLEENKFETEGVAFG
jgi:hypothetical protein